VHHLCTTFFIWTQVQLEGGVCADVAAELQARATFLIWPWRPSEHLPSYTLVRRARGHHVHRGSNGGGYQSITYDAATGAYTGATEMRKDGIAAGY
jgi:gamma-glutamyltranspeptidase/glutathione hydrolase